MITQTLWTDRHFHFDFPPGLYPVILERMRGTLPRIGKMVKGIDENVLEKKTDNRWSVKEHIGHLTDMEELHERRFIELLEGKAVLSPADMQNKKTENAGHNRKEINQLISEFTLARAHFIQQLGNVNDELISRQALHPRLKIPMRLVDLIYFVSEHDDHHLARMRYNIDHETA